MESTIYPKTTDKLRWIDSGLQIFVSNFKLIIVGNSFNEEGFKEMITEAIKQREKVIISKNSMEISTDPRIVKALNSSSMLSSNILLF